MAGIVTYAVRTLTVEGDRLAPAGVATDLPAAETVALDQGESPSITVATRMPSVDAGGQDENLVEVAAKATPKATKKPRHYTILQIGDSHTAADLFTGRVRDILEQRFGPGGFFLPPGLPHAGIRSDAFDIAVSPGWTYQSMARSDESEQFWLTGYTASAATAQADITYAAHKPVYFDAIDVSFVRKPGAGAVQVLLDGSLLDTVELDGPSDQPFIERLQPPKSKLGKFRRLAIRAASAAPVAFTGVFVEQSLSGVSYLSVGFPGAQAKILEKLAPQNFAEDIARIAPDAVVLAFGTNEGFDDNLDLNAYRTTFAAILDAIKKARPGATLVIIGPPAGARQTKNCASGAPAEASSAPAGATGSIPAAPVAEASCWREPVNLEQVRTVQREVASAAGALFWDWSSKLPSARDLEAAHLGSPPLFGPDRVHLTKEGYRRTGTAFAEFLTPLIKNGMASR